MLSTNLKTFVVLILFLCFLTNHVTSLIHMSVKPGGNRVEVGSYWMMECDVDGETEVIWYKWVGDISTRIGYNDKVVHSQGDVISGGRYILKASRSASGLTSSLHLSNSQMEDSGLFVCVAGQTNATSVFVVCQDVDSVGCDCMVENKWANPMCFPQDYTDMSGYYKRILAGLGITLAVVTLYVVAATLLYGRDCIVLFHKDRLEREKIKNSRSGRVEFSRNKNKKDTVSILDDSNDSDQSHLATSQSVGQTSQETVGVREDSGLSGYTQKDTKKVSYRGNKKNTTSNQDISYNNNKRSKMISPQANINYAFNVENELNNRAGINSGNSNVQNQDINQFMAKFPSYDHDQGSMI